MLNNNDRVAEIPELEERLDKLVVIPLVKSDGRLVQHIQHALKACTYLSGKSDPLSLTARESCRRPGERNVFESDIIEELEPRADLP